MHVEVTSLQFFVGQAGVLTPEHQGDLLTADGMLHGLGPAFTGVDQRPGNTALTGTGAHDQAAADQRLLEAVDHLGTGQHIVGTGSTRTGVSGGELFWLHQHQTRQAHVFHGSRSAADVAGVAGIDQNNTNILQQGVVLTDAGIRAFDLTEPTDVTP
ncbi:hypothetical protein D3C79_596190 [compost metagenome]